MALLSVCIPTYERPDGLEQALRSVVTSTTAGASLVEVVVSDNSSSDDSEQLAKKLLDRWPGPSQYHRNVPNVGMVGNFNRCIELSSGDWVLILHDDDYLRPGGLGNVLAGIAGAEVGDRALLFGARVEDERGRLLRPQRFLKARRLAPANALRRHLSQSSFVRFPAIVVHRQAYREVGGFRDTMAAATDVDMWARVFARHGVRLVPATTVSYVVHSDAATTDMFNPDYVQRLMAVFDEATATGVLPEHAVRQARSHWFHQWILAGTFRRLRAGDPEGARKVFDLFQLEPMQRMGVSRRWLPLRRLFQVVVHSRNTP